MNCLITVVVNRRRDLAAMQLLGGSRRLLVTMTLIEAVVVSVTAVVLAIGVAGVTLVPMLHSRSAGGWVPYLPTVVPVAGVTLVGCLVAAGTAGPVAVLTRSAPIDVIAAGP